MARYHVFSSDHTYYGEAYSGTYLDVIEVGGARISYAEFLDFETAKECADKLHEVCATGWRVYNAFYERSVYTTETQQDKTVNS